LHYTTQFNLKENPFKTGVEINKKSEEGNLNIIPWQPLKKY